MLVLPLRHYNTLAGREVRRAQGFLEPCLSVLLEGGGGGKRLKRSDGAEATWSDDSGYVSCLRGNISITVPLL